MLDLRCQVYPDLGQTKKAKKFGEGFTWTCPSCGEQMVLTQGKGDYWYWNKVTAVQND